MRSLEVTQRFLLHTHDRIVVQGAGVDAEQDMARPFDLCIGETNDLLEETVTADVVERISDDQTGRLNRCFD